VSQRGVFGVEFFSDFVVSIDVVSILFLLSKPIINSLDAVGPHLDPADAPREHREGDGEL